MCNDNAKEYFCTQFSSYLPQNGIIHKFSSAITPQQNGVPKRKNYHLLEVSCALLLHIKMSKIFWANAIFTTMFLNQSNAFFNS